MRARFPGVVTIIVLVLLVAFVASGCSGEQGERRDGLHAQVPDVTGQRLQAATDKLEQAGYGLGEVTWTDVSDQPEGVVISQNPVGGTSVARGDSIDLIVAGNEKTVP